MNGFVRFESSIYPWCASEFRIAEPEVRNPDGLTSFVVENGASPLQTYATLDELRALGEMLMAHADESEVPEVAA